MKFLRQAAFSCGLLRDVAQDDSSSRDLFERRKTWKMMADLSSFGRNPKRVGPHCGSLNFNGCMFYVDSEIKRFEVVWAYIKSGNGAHSAAAVHFMRMGMINVGVASRTQQGDF